MQLLKTNHEAVQMADQIPGVFCWLRAKGLLTKQILLGGNPSFYQSLRVKQVGPVLSFLAGREERKVGPQSQPHALAGPEAA